MTSLNNLLNPESGYDYSLRVQPPAQSPTSSTSSPTDNNATERPPADSDYYGSSSIAITPHEPHPNCPDTLTCLPDTEGRPQHTLPVILRCAILGSPKKRLTIREIYAAMEKKYPYYKTAGPAWKQSVRHHLSLNRLFERQPRPATDPGFGSYWTVNLNAPPGTKRPRKRGRANKDAANAAQPPQGTPPLIPYQKPFSKVIKTPDQEYHPSGFLGPPPLPPPSQYLSHPPPQTQPPPPPPPPPIATLRPVDSRSFSQTSTMRVKEYYDDDDDDSMEWDESGRMSDDDYASSDDLPYQYDPRGSNSSALSSHPAPPSAQGSRPVLYGAFSGYASAGYRSAENQESIIERLKLEMTGLRRQSTDAVTASLRMSSQLAEAQAEAARARAALKVTENRLEEEIRRRREAEHVAEDEARLRLAAEEALRAYQLQRRPPGYTSRP
ncbi:hypothetical protein WOLCODRAFT_160695 [Wolfiporia cocos MD-104 SS10]|uniref:Fork-head domain-containing protein n=1 Tax=Wolfiporia cocos (strain MD-104) TaxID=742152 RepID=A0A2H3IXP1_WOLCO|nr:hypothetical protein WOLCODRAFT_160695 [Wolfiporia cocos MD-104 SS10]